MDTFHQSVALNPKPPSLPLVSREWRNGVQLQLLLLPFFHSLLTKGRQVEGSKALSRRSEHCTGLEADDSYFGAV